MAFPFFLDLVLDNLAIFQIAIFLNVFDFYVLVHMVFGIFLKYLFPFIFVDNRCAEGFFSLLLVCLLQIDFSVGLQKVKSRKVLASGLFHGI